MPLCRIELMLSNLDKLFQFKQDEVEIFTGSREMKGLEVLIFIISLTWQLL